MPRILFKYRKLALLFVTTGLGIILGVWLMLQISNKHKFMPDSRYGSVFSLLVSEQMGNAASNLMNLQCWAGSVQMNVVEPSIRETGLNADEVFQFSSDASGEQFRDLFDIEHWNSYGREKGYSPLISLTEFVEKASRNVIYVELTYSGSSKCPQGTFDTISNRLSSLLQSLRRVILSISVYPYFFLSSHGFKIVRKVCIDLLPEEGRLRTQQEFNNLVFGDLLGHGSFTVVFDEWRAIRNESEREGKLDAVDINSDQFHRILIKDSSCTYGCVNHQPYHPSWVRLPPSKQYLSIQPNMDLDTGVLKNSKMGLIPSDRVLKYTAEYRAKYMSNRPYIYIAIMMRMENLHRHGIALSKSSYASCLDTVKNLWTDASQKYGIDQTFITSDLNKYGSYSWPQNAQHLSVQFQRDILKIAGLPTSFAETANENFEEVTGSSGRVKNAWTQGILAAEARCIIFLGGGSFQGLILNTHSALYLGRECFVFLDGYCVQYAKIGFD